LKVLYSAVALHQTAAQFDSAIPAIFRQIPGQLRYRAFMKICLFPIEIRPIFSLIASLFAPRPPRQTSLIGKSHDRQHIACIQHVHHEQQARFA